MSEAPIFVIMAGGQGKRLWPLSREAYPKQFLALAPGGKSLLQHTVSRALSLTDSMDKVLVVTQSRYVPLVRRQLPDLPENNLISEPIGKNTALCLGLAAFSIQERQRESTMVALPVDHLFEDDSPWFSAVKAAIHLASRSNFLVTIGIPPESPSSEFGYLRLGTPLAEVLGCPTYTVRKFIEKPASEQAQKFHNTPGYLWNTGTFIWKISIFLSALQENMPELYESLAKLGTPPKPEKLEKLYANFEAISIDYGVMEKATCLAAVRGNFKRIDVGSLETLARLWNKDLQNNKISGQAVCKDSEDNIVFCDEGLVSLLGMDGVVVIRCGDVVLVCPRERAGEVKELAAEIKAKGLEEYL